MRSATISWPERLLGELMDIARQTVMPGAFPNEQFLHFSIPAWDEKRAPALEVGASIGSAKISVTQPTLLVSKLNPRIPRVVHVKNPVGLRHCASTEFIPYIAKDDSVSLEFFRWFLQSSFFQRRLERIAIGSTNSHTRARPGETLRWSVPCPTLEDQQRIAAVLDTVDEAIAKTEAVIAKLKQVRAGLLHDLLTRGLDEHGQLRDPIAHPKQFKNSPVGPIPREWDIRSLRSCLATNPQNGIYKPARQIGHGTLLVGQTSITDDRFIDTSLARRVEVAASEINRFGLREGDVLISRVFATLSGVGLPALVTRLTEPAVYESNMMRLQVDTAVIAPRLLFESLRSARVRTWITAAAHLSNQASINQAGLNPIPICIQSADEQEEMILRILGQEASIKTNEEELAKLQSTKSGLMTDLLTGRVRVPVGIAVTS